MSTRTAFPYQFKIINNDRLADPVVYLEVVTKSGVRKIGFLVDSGSDTVILPLLHYQFWFDFTPNVKQRTTLGGVEGKGVTAYPSKIAIQIGQKKINARCFFVSSNTIPLLGRLDIWDKFNWFFDNRENRVIFDRI